MKHTLRFFLACALACALAGSVRASAQPASYEVESTGDRPLMVIRFNQQRVTYERPLYDTVSRALEVKPSVMFEIVSVAPKARDPDNQPHNDEVAARNTQRVLGTLSEMGLPQSRITLTHATDAVASSEVRIFVH